MEKVRFDMSNEDELKQKIAEKEEEIEKIQREFESKKKDITQALTKESEGIIEKMRLELKTAQKKLLSMTRQLKDYKDHNETSNVTQFTSEVGKMFDSVKKLMDAIQATSREKERYIAAKLKELIRERTHKIKDIHSEIKNIFKQLIYSKYQEKESIPPEDQK